MCRCRCCCLFLSFLFIFHKSIVDDLEFIILSVECYVMVSQITKTHEFVCAESLGSRTDIDTLVAFVLVHTHLLFNKSAINVNKTVINGIRAVDDFDAFVIYMYFYRHLSTLTNATQRTMLPQTIHFESHMWKWRLPHVVELERWESSALYPGVPAHKLHTYFTQSLVWHHGNYSLDMVSFSVCCVPVDNLPRIETTTEQTTAQMTRIDANRIFISTFLLFFFREKIFVLNTVSNTQAACLTRHLRCLLF